MSRNKKEHKKQPADKTSKAKYYSPSQEPRAGEPCPNCGKANLDYDGCLNLVCTHCDYVSGGVFH